MRKALILAASAALAGSMLVTPIHAQSVTPIPIPENSKNAKTNGDQPTVSQLMAYDEARIARFKADLRLKPDQEKLWSKLESTLKDISKRRAERVIAQKDEHDKRKDAPTAVERLRLDADAMAEHAANMKKIADAAEPLFDKLDDQQKRRLTRIIRQQAAVEPAWYDPAFDEENGRKRRGFHIYW
jgi:hypothetical protein